MLGSADYRAILSLLERSGRAVTLDGFAESVLEGVQRELGYASCVLMIVEPTPAGPIATSGAMRGGTDRTEEYFERWREREPFIHAAARARFARHGLAHLGSFYSELDAPQREFCRDFLATQSIRDQLSAQIDTGLAKHGFLTLHGDERTRFAERDRALMMALRPHLANQLRTLLSLSPDGRLGKPAAGRALSPRQREVAELAARGLSNAEIGRSLGIAEATAKKHMIGVFRILGVSSRAQLVARAARLASESG